MVQPANRRIVTEAAIDARVAEKINEADSATKAALSATIATVVEDPSGPVADVAAKAQPSNAFPVRRLAGKLDERYVNGTVQQARVLAFGDSIALFKWHYLYPILSRAFGGTTSAAGIVIGSGVSGTGWSTPGVSNSGTTGTVTLQTNAFSIWPSGFADLYATGATKKYGSLGGNATWDKAKVYYAKESGSGTFKVQVDGVDEPGYENVSAAGSGLGIITITRGTVAARELKVVNLTGTHRVIGAAFERSDRAGVVFANISQGGIALDQQTTQGYANFQAFLTDYDPDLITFEMKENSNYLAAKMDEFLDVIDAGAPLATFVGIGSTPLAVNDVDQVVQNAQIKVACEAHGKVYWDGYTPFGSYAVMNALGWAGDGIHVGEKASSFLAGLMARDLGILDHPGADRPANVNANKLTAQQTLTMGIAAILNGTGTDLLIDGTGTGSIVFRKPDGTVTAKFPVGASSSQAVLPNTAQIGLNNARITADANGIKSRTPDGSADATFGASKVTTPVLRLTAYTTANRPSGATLGDGSVIFDSDLGKSIQYSSGAWKNLDGTAL